jgi:hypothetical protein
MFTFVSEGTVNGNSGFVLTTDDAITLDTTALVFAQFSSPGAYTGGAGLVLTGLDFSIASADNSLTINADSIQAKLSASGAVSVAGDGLAVAVGDGIEVSSNALRFKLDGASLTRGSSGVKISAANFITRETPGGAMNGSNTAFTLASTPASGSEMIFLNGILQEPGGEDYTISGANITYAVAPLSTDRMRANYRLV